MKKLSIMIKPASCLCNLRCKYCFYADVADLRSVRSYGVMTEETTKAILSHIREDLTAGDEVTFAFQGGEPTLAGLSYFRTFLALTADWEGIGLHYAIQTNGILLDDEWCDFLSANNFLVGISWDILPDNHDTARVDAVGKGTNRRVLDAIKRMNSLGVEYNVLCTLTNFTARHPEQVWKQLIRYDIRYVQFTPCLDDLSAPGVSPYALTPARFASFYDGLFPLWYRDYLAGHYRSIKLIDDIVNLLAFGIPTACGINGHCSPQLVVEADGSTYPCDFYCLDEYCLGNLSETRLKDIYESPRAAGFVHRDHKGPSLCASCEFFGFCGGNCKRMQRQICCAPGEPVCGYRDFLSHHKSELEQIAKQERRFRS